MLSGIIYQFHNPSILKFLLLQSKGVGAWALVPLSYASDSGAARICQRGNNLATERSDRAWRRYGRGLPPPPPHGREIVRKFVYENGIFLHIKYLLGGRLCEVAYTNPLPSLLYMFLFLLTGGGGAWTLVLLIICE